MSDLILNPSVIAAQQNSAFAPGMRVRTEPAWGRFRRGLLFFVVAELALLGSGRLLMFGPLTGRMLLFLVAMGWTCVQLLRGSRLRSETVLVTGCFSFLMILGVLEGLLSGSDPSMVFANLKPWSYFFMLLFFELAIRDVKDIETIVKILRYSGLILAVACITVLVLQLTDVISPAILYEFLSGAGAGEGSQEFMGRFAPGTNIVLFTYKGFLYLCVATILWGSVPGWRKCYSIICATAVLLTLVRGYVLALIGAALAYFLFFEKRLRFRVAAVVIVIVGSVIAFASLLSYRSDTSESDLVRLETISQVLDRETVISTFTGHGLGVGVPIKTESMEITYLQVFHQQGMIGLCFLAYLFGSMTYYAWKAKQAAKPSLAVSFYLLGVLVFLVTSTNPAINNPIGMGVMLIGFVVLRVPELQSIRASAPSS